MVCLSEKLRRRGVGAECAVEETTVDYPHMEEERGSSKGDSVYVRCGQEGRARHIIEERERVHSSKKRRKVKDAHAFSIAPETTIDYLEKGEDGGASFYLQPGQNGRACRVLEGNEMAHLSKKKRLRAAIHAVSSVEETALACLEKKKKRKKKRRRSEGDGLDGGKIENCAHSQGEEEKEDRKASGDATKNLQKKRGEDCHGDSELETQSNSRRREKRRSDDQEQNLAKDKKKRSREFDGHVEDTMYGEYMDVADIRIPSASNVEQGAAQVQEQDSIKLSKRTRKKKKREAQGTMEAGGENLREEQELKQTTQHHGKNENPVHLKDATVHLTDEHCRASSAGKVTEESSKNGKKVTFSDQHEVWQCGSQREKLDAKNLASEANKLDMSNQGEQCSGQHEVRQGDFQRENLDAKNIPLDINELDTNIQGKRKRRSSREDENCVWGKRFTAEEDEIIKCAVLDYIKASGWSEETGLKIILNNSKHKEARNCWSDIRSCLPHRPRDSIWYRAHTLFEEGRRLGQWSKEENDALIKMQEEYGHNWHKISVLLGRGRQNIKEKWRSLKRSKSKGCWTQDDLQKLSDLVHKCLRLKSMVGSSRSKNDHRVFRDDINWEVIADEIGCHSHGSCCGEWYYTLASSMVASGEWANGDDRLLLQRLLESGACSEEEVEWDQLLEHRSGQTCMTRWQQMQKHLGENQRKQFLEKLDLLSLRYAPDLLEG